MYNLVFRGVPYICSREALCVHMEVHHTHSKQNITSNVDGRWILQIEILPKLNIGESFRYLYHRSIAMDSSLYIFVLYV